MAGPTLPMRFRIVEYMNEKEAVTADDLLQATKPEYGTEGQHSMKTIDSHLASFVAGGMAEIVELDFRENQLLTSYRLTEYGRSRLKYLPKG